LFRNHEHAAGLLGDRSREGGAARAIERQIATVSSPYTRLSGLGD